MTFKSVIYTQHALHVMAERNLDRTWIERTVREPQWREPDSDDSAVTRCFAIVPERGSRYLRVACVETETEIRILSAFLDRGARPR